MTTKPVQRRLDGINAVLAQIVTFPKSHGGNREIVWVTQDYDVMLVAIRSLYALGRTARWTCGVDAWLGKIMEAKENDGTSLQWAVTQGYIDMFHVAD